MINTTSTAGRTRLGAVAAPLRAGAPDAVAASPVIDGGLAGSPVPSAPEHHAQLRASVRPRRDL